MRRAPAAAALAVATLAASRAGAHEVGLSRGDYVVEGAAVKSQVVFARKEILSLVAGLDRDRDGALSDAEIAAAGDAIEGALVGRVHVKGDGVPCPGKLARVEPAEADGVAVHAVHRCAAHPTKLDVELPLLADLSFGHRHLARGQAGAVVVDRVLSQRSPSFSFDVPPEAVTAAPAKAASRAPLQRGLLHVLTRPFGAGFLLALLSASSDLRGALRVTAAFAAAVMAGIALGASGLFLPGPRALGPAICLSLVYAGIDAAVSRSGPQRAPGGPAPLVTALSGGFGGSPPTMTASRWPAALSFGVVHGLFALAALQADGSRAELGAFTLGVLLALAAVIAALVPATRWALRRPAFARRGAIALGAAIAAWGAVGLAARGVSAIP